MFIWGFTVTIPTFSCSSGNFPNYVKKLCTSSFRLILPINCAFVAYVKLQEVIPRDSVHRKLNTCKGNECFYSVFDTT